MRYNKWFSIVMLVAVMVGGMLQPAQAQEWSSGQKAVWSNVNAYWDAFAKGDTDGMMSYFHSDYLGWSFNEPLPGGKMESAEGIAHFSKKNSIVMHRIKPVGINVQGNFAVVHYYFNMTIRNAEGKEKNNSGRWTDVLVKKGDKWLLIGDSGGNLDD